MPSFTRGQVAVGGKKSWVELLDPDGSLSLMIQQLDDIERPMDNVMGESFNARRSNLYTSLTPDQTMPYTPHDICWFPDNSGLLVAVAPDIGMLEFRKYDLDGNQLYGPEGSLGAAWTPATDFGWALEPVKIDIACDSKTVYYTDSLRTIFRYDLQTKTQLDHYQQLPDDADYVYGGVKVLSQGLARTTHTGGLEIGPVVVVAMTIDGDGPRRAICLSADRGVWVDEVNPATVYHVFKRALIDGEVLLSPVTQADPDGDNDETLSLACNFSSCATAAAAPRWIAVVG